MHDTEIGPVPQVSFPIIGIGASAGGLEAVTAMFHNIEPGLGLAYVLVMHLDPNHESLMVELLSRKTRVDVRTIADGDEIHVGSLHVIPPGYSMTMDGARFRLDSFDEPRGLRRPIDTFFTSLAHTQGEKSACVVLSGTGADGTAGTRVTKDLGGVAAVQSPEEARYDGMPFSALSTNLVDFTLPADEIIPRLQAYFEGHQDPMWSRLQGLQSAGGSDSTKQLMSEIFDAVLESTGNDFSGYKPSMLLRRLNRRLQVQEEVSIENYIDRLKTDRREQEALARDFLINVTSFFRDWEKFEILRKTVIVPMIQRARSSDELRIWIPGCSSGQEAYSMAMMVDKTCEELQRRPLIQIFATDIDEEMLARARRGEYLMHEFSDLPKAYQESYALALDGKFEVISRIRDMVRFSHHNLIQDPPFSKIDLISCRNLLIYLGEDLQTDLFPVLHFSLKPHGHLFLGTSENVSRQSDLFSVVDQNARIFRRIETGKRSHLNMPLGRGTSVRTGRGKQQKMSEEQDFPGYVSLNASNEEIYQEYAPPFVRVTRDGRVISSSGDLGLFLLARPGEERELYNLLRDGMKDTVLSLLSSVVHEGRRQAIEDVDVVASFGTLKADVIAHPMRDDTVAIVFMIREQLQPIVKKYAVAPISPDRRVADLQQELSRTQLQLKGKVEEVETANEELKSSNEEMMSMNEELQSANEELTTANEELKNKIDELTLANADLDNFLRSADLAMVVLDRSLRIRHVTEAAGNLLPIKKADSGRFLTEFNISSGLGNVAEDVRRVMDTHEAFEATTGPDSNGRSLLVRITPYFFKDGMVEGATITLTNISTEVELRTSLGIESERLKLAMRAGNLGFGEFDIEEGTVQIDNVLASHYGFDQGGSYTFDDLLARIVPEDLPEIDRNISHAIETLSEYDYDYRIKLDDGIRHIRTRGTPYTTEDGKLRVVGLTLDITEIVNQEQSELLVQEMSHRVKNLFSVVSSLIRLTARQYDDTQTMAEDLMDRIASLGAVYDLARRQTELTGVDLKELLNAVLTPHISSQSIKFEGPDLHVAGDALNTFSLIIHELTTNAYKYGALSVPDGALGLTWDVDDKGLVQFDWSEHVPDFDVPKPTSGFGTEMLEGATAHLRGSFERSFTDHGALVRFSLLL